MRRLHSEISVCLDFRVNANHSQGSKKMIKQVLMAEEDVGKVNKRTEPS